MQLRYHADLLEAVAFGHASGRRGASNAKESRQFHHERERLYSIANNDEREAAFFRLNLGWFRRWGFEARLLALASEFPLLAASLEVLAFRKAAGRHDEGAELFVKPGCRNTVVALRPERFCEVASLEAFLRHEFTHVHDMVDSAFGYEPGLRVANPNQLRLARERYRLLWDITIDGRLARAGHATQSTRAQHEAAFDRAFSFWDEPKRRETFESLWRLPAPRHERLAAIATDPRDLARSPLPLPGAPCPLCGFPTFDWAETSELPADSLTLLSGEFPEWTPAVGLCGRCAEMYAVNVSQAVRAYLACP